METAKAVLLHYEPKLQQMQNQKELLKHKQIKQHRSKNMQNEIFIPS